MFMGLKFVSMIINHYILMQGTLHFKRYSQDVFKYRNLNSQDKMLLNYFQQ